ncbi:protein-export membrane protein SecD [Candidatus Woesebacteria bacterium RIFCSPHIGHO2_02_FULL_42_20]|uniref:Protein translocase subunit SecD n=1 Tax=Candidatus Woesebacteria bacterium RIFCSPHIGHO2_12_FULL_41_24 TaxID=1802510 RepID=A0A1F8ATI6_9BACT|nr:MAG: protein-export membrane protein SecD [Candidatus Woesebacteria bacterium RBG_16_41_13]OGM29094.1 MAG: protein-export membrane protein SecD [Candidatus Woesebacteria bacterium RIFCSPHIGHO2_01_FULL_42_80]OGM34802.1 MAG: protein-export membrane protein SecD [Candidatus Woesebacteria bacterium RIFCSPHIGHO2_02_FULL_42_20]OGM54545.1 MAG: protein-export membrane protein SecD [Candidatus Woesebacteria bacterium RIFCSPHIGHO2_12_FULL_41_24]OGM66748.1 MAG: protein-export membrane protein SecD [Can
MKKILFIMFLTVLGLVVDLPIQPGINFKLGSFAVQRKLDLVLGLDLAGGSHLVFEAQAGNLDPEKKKLALDGLKNIVERRVNLFGVSEPNVLLSSFEGNDRLIVELPGVKDTKEAINIIGKTAKLEFATFQGEGEDFQIVPTDLSGADLTDARVSFDQTSGRPVVSIQFNSEGAEKFSRITEENIGQPLSILLDGEIISSPIVQETITGGAAQISGDFTLDEARNFAIQLSSGALPVSISVVEERTIGPTLGEESVQRSVEAGLIGLAMVLLFMIASYGRMGIVASFGLIIFGILSLALYKLIPVVITLPGIAGFLLSVGMAVDSNILIFERFKEEKIKRNTRDALEESFGRAWDSIRDANIATLITAFILANPFDWSFLHTSGPVRGFAITLALGIAISLFTGVFVSRNLLRLFIRR